MNYKDASGPRKRMYALVCCAVVVLCVSILIWMLVPRGVVIRLRGATQVLSDDSTMFVFIEERVCLKDMTPLQEVFLSWNPMANAGSDHVRVDIICFRITKDGAQETTSQISAPSRLGEVIPFEGDLVCITSRNAAGERALYKWSRDGFSRCPQNYLARVDSKVKLISDWNKDHGYTSIMDAVSPYGRVGEAFERTMEWNGKRVVLRVLRQGSPGSSEYSEKLVLSGDLVSKSGDVELSNASSHRTFLTRKERDEWRKFTLLHE